MSRLALTLSILAGATCFATAASAAVVFEPDPVPAACQQPEAPRLGARYVRQLDVLNRYVRVVDPRVTVDLMQRPCPQETLYWRKADLLRAARGDAAAVVAPANSMSATPRGTILIIPNRLLDQRLRDVKNPAVARAE